MYNRIALFPTNISTDYILNSSESCVEKIHNSVYYSNYTSFDINIIDLNIVINTTKCYYITLMNCNVMYFINILDVMEIIVRILIMWNYIFIQ